jgi:hypothetical protein
VLVLLAALAAAAAAAAACLRPSGLQGGQAAWQGVPPLLLPLALLEQQRTLQQNTTVLQQQQQQQTLQMMFLRVILVTWPKSQQCCRVRARQAAATSPVNIVCATAQKSDSTHCSRRIKPQQSCGRQHQQQPFHSGALKHPQQLMLLKPLL